MRAVCSLLLLVLAARQSPPAVPAAAIDAFVEREIRTRRIPGAAVAVVTAGSTTYSKAFGVANLETDTPVTTASVFEIASVTKPFTAAAILLLAEEGRVALDDSITKYVTGAPAAWAPVTVRHLLTHTSGLPVDAIPGAQGSALLNITTQAAYEWVRQLPMLFAPGERASYSDAGYFLLGMVVERASGLRYAEFLQQRIFTPAGMPHAGILDRARILKGRVPVYTLRGGELAHWRRDWQYELPSFFGMQATAGDLAAFDVALREGRVLPAAAQERMLTPARLSGDRDALVAGQLYGLGWELGYIGGQRTAGHSGASGTYVLRFVDLPLSVIVLTNLDVATGPHAAAMARQIALIVRPDLRSPFDPQNDPDPALTRELGALLEAIAAGQSSPAMTEAHASFFQSLPAPRRAALARQLTGARALVYLGEQRVDRPWLSADPIVRVLHYRFQSPDGPMPVRFELTGARKVAMLRLGQ